LNRNIHTKFKGDITTTFKYSGFSDSLGASGTVVFSMNTSATIESGIPGLPAGLTIISKYLKAGPEAFNFNLPVQIYFPAASESSPQNLLVYYYSPGTNDWKIVTTSAIDTAGKRIGVDVFQLGYFVLAKSLTTDNSMTDTRQGGCVLDLPAFNTFYTITMASVVLEKPETIGLYYNGLVGNTYTGPIFLGCQIGQTKAIVPQGSMTFWVTKIECQGGDQQPYTYSIPAPVTVSNPLNFIGWSTYDAVTYVPFTLPSGGTWNPGRPSSGPGAWPPPTIPFGSGIFQATLTWNNSTNSVADLDLHLYGPNNLHIFWQNRTSPNFALDRDWISQLGNAIENIYSTTSTIPSGNYEVKVHHYSGVQKSFNTRVILNGASTNYSGSLTNGQEVTVRTFTIP
jgi:hypothetical protein